MKFFRFQLPSSLTTFHLRCIYGTVFIALTIFVGFWLYARTIDSERFGDDARAARADVARLSLFIDRELTSLRAERSRDLERSVRASSSAPFLVRNVIPSLAEVICVDNKKHDVFFTGSGTFIDPQGMIVTNYHILLSDDGSLIRHCAIGVTDDVSEPPDVRYIARVVAVSEEEDLALLIVTESLDKEPIPTTFSSLLLTESSEVAKEIAIGDPVFIGGYPGIGEETFTLTSGVVSGRVGDYLIKTSALIDTGASGGAAFDGQGRFIGVPTAAAKGDIGGSLGYIIGANIVDQFLADYASGKNLLPTVKQ